ncbi:hypothetical protein ACHHYP_09785 [Achlya hypogyna]|uniref:START domain-containing protein n=1 Tax=Achlya hypogyna TaxID=1202772 RepID=A0A1V9YME5_ACHHY|nr:hypothetical protein ACHHYP_09785 [Achlya hypogyna]
MKFVAAPAPMLVPNHRKPADFEVPPSSIPGLAHIKSKRVKELECLRHQVYVLQSHIERLKRCQSTQLSWEDVAQALKDDTLDQVRDNRSLKKKLGHNQRMGQFLKLWMTTMAPPTRPLSLSEESWRHSHLVAGDDASRQLGYEWIARQSFHNTTAAMAHVSFPDDGAGDFVRVHVQVSDDYRFVVQVAAQQVVAADLDAVNAAFWAAERSFAAAFRDRCTQLTDLSVPTEDIMYLRENLGTASQRMVNKTIQARFRTPTSTTFVLRSILKDDMFPLDDDDDAWSFNTKEWMVAEPLADGSTRCRTFYTIDHPCTAKGGDVSLNDIGRCVDLSMPDDEALVRVLKERFLNSHHAQRRFFAEHFRRVLAAMVASEDLVQV